MKTIRQVLAAYRVNETLTIQEAEKAILDLLIVGVTLPTKEEIAIEGSKRYPIDLKDKSNNYSDTIQRLNFIIGATWLKDKMKSNGN